MLHLLILILGYSAYPRDLDYEQPILEMSFYKQLKSYTSLKTTKKKLIQLLKKYQFQPIISTLTER